MYTYPVPHQVHVYFKYYITNTK